MSFAALPHAGVAVNPRRVDPDLSGCALCEHPDGTGYRHRSRPGTDMVLRLADELGLSPREKNAMLQAAGLRALFSHHAMSDSEMTRYHAVIDSLLDRHEPLPAAVIDRYGALVRTNAAFERLTPGLAGVEPEDLVDRLLGPGPWRDTLVNGPEVAAAWLSRHRLEADRTGDPRLRALSTGRND